FQDWVRNETPYVREFVLFNGPRPLPNSLLNTYRDETRKAIATTHDGATIHVAVQQALEFKIPVDQVLGMLVERLRPEERQLYHDLRLCLAPLLATGKYECPYVGCARTPDKKAIVAIKAAWKRFLQEQGQAIRDGKRFGPNSPEFRRLIYPNRVEDDEM